MEFEPLAEEPGTYELMMRAAGGPVRSVVSFLPKARVWDTAAGIECVYWTLRLGDHRTRLADLLQVYREKPVTVLPNVWFYADGSILCVDARWYADVLDGLFDISHFIRAFAKPDDLLGKYAGKGRREAIKQVCEHLGLPGPEVEQDTLFER